MENLLKDLLNPTTQNDAYKTLLTKIKTQQGMSEFYSQLKSNNKVSFLFLKNITAQAIADKDSQVLELLVRDIRKYMELLYVIDDSNLTQLLVFFETLGQSNYLAYDFFSFLQGLIIQYGNNNEILGRMLRVLDVTTKKYTTHTRSNALYTEINQNVELFGAPVFNFLKQSIFLEQTVEILYNFIFQDIPTFFEEKSSEINIILNNLLLSNESNILEKTCNVLTLFVLKYPECADTMMIMGNLCNLLSLKKGNQITDLEKHLFCSIIRRKELSVLSSQINQIIPILYKLCYLNADIESLEYYRNTRNIERDIYRSNIAETISVIDNLFCPDYSCYNFGRDEAFIFFCTVLGRKQEHAVLNIYHLEVLDDQMLNAIARYFLVHEIFVENHDKLIVGLANYNFAFFYIVAYLNFLSKNGISTFINDSIITTIINYDENSNDEVRSTFLYQAMLETKNRNGSISDNLMTYLYNQFTNYSTFTIYESYFKIFDCLALCIIQNKMCAEIYMITQRIFQTENEDIYPLTIQLLALLVQKDIYTPDIHRIFSTEPFWMVKELLTPLCLLGLSLYRKNHIDRKILQNLCDFLILKDQFTAYLILENLQFDNDEEYFMFTMYVAQKKISYDGLLIILSKMNINNDRYTMAVEKCLDELLQSVAGKKNLNRMKKACLVLKQKVNEAINIKTDALLVRNEQRRGVFENILDTVITTFEL